MVLSFSTSITRRFHIDLHQAEASSLRFSTAFRVLIDNIFHEFLHGLNFIYFDSYNAVIKNQTEVSSLTYIITLHRGSLASILCISVQALSSIVPHKFNIISFL